MSRSSRKKKLIIAGLMTDSTAAGIGAALPAHADTTLSVVYRGAQDGISLNNFLYFQCTGAGYRRVDIITQATNADGSINIVYRCSNP